MKLFIPPIKTKLILAQPWTFKLFSEDRNEKLIEAFRECGCQIKPRPKSPNNPWEYYGVAIHLCDFTLDVNTELIVNRYYIRQGKGEFDSVTFYLTSVINGKKIKGRFWAKLDDVNKIEAQ